jgi:Rho termination factor, N-terminal domain
MEALSEVILAVINIIIPACTVGITTAFLVGFLEYRYTTHDATTTAPDTTPIVPNSAHSTIPDTTSTTPNTNLELRPGSGTGDHPTGGGAHHLPFHRSSPPTPCPTPASLPTPHPQVTSDEGSADIRVNEEGSDTKVGDLDGEGDLEGEGGADDGCSKSVSPSPSQSQSQALKSKTVVELKAIAKGLGMTGFSCWNKRELVNQIELVLGKEES